jgi:hypothetical protein
VATEETEEFASMIAMIAVMQAASISHTGIAPFNDVLIRDPDLKDSVVGNSRYTMKKIAAKALSANDM